MSLVRTGEKVENSCKLPARVRGVPAEGLPWAASLEEVTDCLGPEPPAENLSVTRPG
jgi:hypothetical protein